MADPVEVEQEALTGEEGTVKGNLQLTDAGLVRRHGAMLLKVLEDNLSVPLREVLKWEESLDGFGGKYDADDLRVDPANVSQQVTDAAFVYMDWLKEHGCTERVKLLQDALEGVEDSCYSRLRSVRRDSPLRQELRDKAMTIGARLSAMLTKEKE